LPSGLPVYSINDDPERIFDNKSWKSEHYKLKVKTLTYNIAGTKLKEGLLRLPLALPNFAIKFERVNRQTGR